MDELKEQVKVLKKKWKELFKVIIQNEQQLKPHAPYTSTSALNEVLQTTINLFDRVRAPKGFEPNFHLARSLAMVNIQLVLKDMDNLQAGQWAYLPNFLNRLNQLLACFHNLIIFSDKKEIRESIGLLTDRLSQSLALVDTTQTTLKDRLVLLQEANEKAAQIKREADLVSKIKSSSQKTYEEIETDLTSIKEKMGEIETNKAKITELVKKLNNEISKNEELNTQISEQTENISVINEKHTEQQKLISNLLPLAASAGLAHSFRERADKLNKTKFIWLGLFLFSIAGLIGIGIWIFKTQLGTPHEIWEGVLERLPLTAPLIWLGWISALQYGNVIRIQEDYSFKEATSKAFVGYRDHMEHLSTISDESSKTALDLLSSKTIEILSKSPLRIYRKSEDDVSFWKSLKGHYKPENIPSDE